MKPRWMKDTPDKKFVDFRFCPTEGEVDQNASASPRIYPWGRASH